MGEVPLILSPFFFYFLTGFIVVLGRVLSFEFYVNVFQRAMPRQDRMGSAFQSSASMYSRCQNLHPALCRLTVPPGGNGISSLPPPPHPVHIMAWLNYSRVPQVLPSERTALVKTCRSHQPFPKCTIITRNVKLPPVIHQSFFLIPLKS